MAADLFAWLSVICAFVSFALAFVVLSNDKKNPANRLFFALGIFISLLSIADFMTFSIPEGRIERAVLYYKFLNMWPLASVLILHFAAAFTGNRKLLNSRLFLTALYVPVLVYLMAVFVFEGIVPEVQFSGVRYRFRGFLNSTVITAAVFSWVGLVSIAAFLMLVLHGIMHKTAQGRNKSFVVAFAVTVPMLSGVTNAFFESVLNETPGTLMSFIMIAIIGVAVLARRLFEINPAAIADNVINTAHSIIIITDENDVIIRANPASCTALKMAEREILGMDFMALLEDGSMETVVSLYGGKGSTNELEAAFKTGDGRKVSVLMTVSDLYDSAGRLKGHVISALDISDRKQLETEIMTAMQEVENVNLTLREKNAEIEDNYNKLKEVDEMKQNFIAIVSHELRTPLTSIMGFLKFMIHGAAGPVTEKQKEFLFSMENSSERLLRLINELLDVSKIESGTFSIDSAKRDVSLTVMEGVKQILPVAQQRKIKIETRIPSAYAVTAMIDDYRMAQVVINLANNSLKFSQPDTVITVSLDKKNAADIILPSYIADKTKLSGDYAVITVRDQGVGMSPEHAEKIFERFYQIETPNTRKHAGIGLGLYISRNIVTAHKGYIWAESEGSEKGALFTVIIPAND